MPETLLWETYSHETSLTVTVTAFNDWYFLFKIQITLVTLNIIP